MERKRLFNFSHDYYKLHKPLGEICTTIRGIGYNKKHKFTVPVIGFITFRYKNIALVSVFKYEDKIIDEIPLQLLKDDAEYYGFEIETKQDFVDLVNSFTPFKNTTLESIKRIFYYYEISRVR